MHGHCFEKRTHPAFGEESSAESAILQLGKQLGRDAAGHVDASRREDLEREITCLGAVEAAERLHGAAADRVARARRVRDGGRRVVASGQHRLRDRGRQRGSTSVRDCLGQVDQTIAGEDALPGDVLVPVQQEAEDADLHLVARRERRVASFRGEHFAMAALVQYGGCLSQTGARADERPRTAQVACAFVQGDQILLLHRGNAERERVEIVRELHDLDAEYLGQLALVEHPRKVRRVRAAAGNGAGDTEGRTRRKGAAELRGKRTADSGQAGVLPAVVALALS